MMFLLLAFLCEVDNWVGIQIVVQQKTEFVPFF